MGFFFGTLLTILSIFLVLLVLVQRGRGGGLTGALGGMGGSSAFGAKAGDVFTRITIVVATVWIVVCAAAFYWANHQDDRLGSTSRSLPAAPAGPALEPPATGEKRATAETNSGQNEAAPAASESAPSASGESAPASSSSPAEPAESPAPATK